MTTASRPCATQGSCTTSASSASRRECCKRPDRSTDEEFDAIKRHPWRGTEMVRGIEFLEEAYNGIMHHHERLDGRGYPMGLAGRDIPEFARIIAVADAFDSMTSTRSYRGARQVPEALRELDELRGHSVRSDHGVRLDRGTGQ